MDRQRFRPTVRVLRQPANAPYSTAADRWQDGTDLSGVREVGGGKIKNTTRSKGDKMDLTSSRLTPIIDSYDTCEKTIVTLCIYNIHPDIVTQKLGMTPSSSKIKGFLNKMPNGVERIGTIHNWLLSSKDAVSSKDLRRHLDWILVSCNI
jgi:hypothetical protein